MTCDVFYPYAKYWRRFQAFPTVLRTHLNIAHLALKQWVAVKYPLICKRESRLFTAFAFRIRHVVLAALGNFNSER
jgi:hypothetical protein